MRFCSILALQFVAIFCTMSACAIRDVTVDPNWNEKETSTPMAGIDGGGNDGSEWRSQMRDGESGDGNLTVQAGSGGIGSGSTTDNTTRDEWTDFGWHPGNAAEQLSCARSAQGAIESQGQANFYIFEGAPDELVFVTLVETSGFSEHARISIRTPTGGDSASFDSNNVHELLLAEVGTYVARISARNGSETGNYRLDLLCPARQAPLSATFKCGDSHTGSLEETGELDIFAFEAEGGDQIAISLVATTGFSSKATSVLFSPTGSTFHSHDNNGAPTLFLPEDGIYFIHVRAKNLIDTGSYRTGLQCITPAAPVLAELECGESQSGSLEDPGEAAYYTFEGESGNQIAVSLNTTAGGTTRAVLYNPSGSQLHYFDANGAPVVTLPETGTYSIRLYAKNLIDTSSYRVGLQCITPAAPVLAELECGESQSGSISIPGQADYYTFEGEAGEQVDITLNTTAGSTSRIVIYNPSGSQMSYFDANRTSSLSLPETGTYVLRAYSKNFVDTGVYDLTLTCPVVATLQPFRPNHSKESRRT